MKIQSFVSQVTLKTFPASHFWLSQNQKDVHSACNKLDLNLK